MKNKLFFLLFWACSLAVYAEDSYVALDPGDPVAFYGDRILYAGDTILLDEWSFFIDGRLGEETAARYPYVFRSIQEAALHLRNGSDGKPMTLYIAPYVYWIDDPDDPQVRMPEEGSIPYGMKIRCDGLRFYGLNKNPENVVLAANRGQTHGAIGNFTMFHLEGDDITAENLTFGNYCNVDLEYPLWPELNRKRRADAIVQAQLIICNSDRVVARNTRFISRLNLCPFAGAKRALFTDCYFECTDDALCGTGVYLRCGFTFFSSRPFYNARGTGAVFLDCDLHVLTRGKQYLTKAGGQIAMVDCRFTHEGGELYIGWSTAEPPYLPCYQDNVTLNGRPYLIDGDLPEYTVDISRLPISDAYRFDFHGQRIYNTYNLLRGDDEWDPEGIGPVVREAERETGRNLSSLAVQLLLQPGQAALLTPEDTLRLKPRLFRFGGYETSPGEISFRITGDTDRIVLRQEEGAVVITGNNHSDDSESIGVAAYDGNGVKGLSVLTILPSVLPSPMVVDAPRIECRDSGVLELKYRLELDGYEDRSVINWYRSDEKTGKSYPVSVSRMGAPETCYRLQEGDAGFRVYATLSPRTIRSQPGEEVRTEYPETIWEKDIFSGKMETDFRNFPTAYQPEVLPGFWTVDAYKPADTDLYQWSVGPGESWFYGEGVDGAKGHYGLLEAVRGARLMYTPVRHTDGAAQLELLLLPCKPAGQGFGSATGQYLEVYIKYDPETLTGYGVRIERTPRNDKAVELTLMEYKNGAGEPLTEPLVYHGFKSDCRLKLSFENESLKCCIESQDGHHDVNTLTYPAAENHCNGYGILLTGSVGASAVMLKELRFENNFYK